MLLNVLVIVFSGLTFSLILFFIKESRGLSLLGLPVPILMMIVVIWGISAEVETETYKKALNYNPYEMVILYDSVKNPMDTIYKLK